MDSISGKEIILGALAVASGLVNAYLWKGAVLTSGFANATFYSLPVIALVAAAIFFSLSAIFIRSARIRSLAAVLSLAPGFLLIPYSATLLAPVALTSLGAWYATREIAQETASGSFHSRKILRGGLPLFLTSFALMVTVFYFSSVSSAGGSIFLPKALFDAVIPLLEKPLQGILPGFRSEASVDELLLAFASRQLGGELDPSGLPKEERDELLSQSRETLSQQFGITLTGNEKAGDLLYRLTNAQVAKFLGPWRQYMPFLAAAGFFIAIKTFTLPVYWLALILMAGVVKLLLAIGVIKAETETVQVTKLTL